MLDYYKILDLPTDANERQIKESYRKKLKDLHPDLNRSFDTQRLQGLMQAYRTLIDKEHRTVYDRNRGGHASFRYRDFLVSQKNQPQARVKLLFYDLLHDNVRTALELYENSLLSEGIQIQQYISYEDYMDCLFLLAEAYEQEKSYLHAYRLFIIIVRLEAVAPCFHHFIAEVLDRLYQIVCVCLPKIETRECTLCCIAQTMMLPFSSKRHQQQLAKLYNKLRDGKSTAIRP